jgi:hypothetical protein
MPKSMFFSFLKSRPIFHVLLASLLASGWLHAAPCGPGGKEIEWTQPDGSKLALRVFGDEFYGRTETLDGYTVVFDPATKAYHYASLSPDGNEFASTGKILGKADPKTFGLGKRIEINPASRAAKAGNVVGLTILVDFSDCPGTVVTQSQIDDYCNKPNYTDFLKSGSVYDYFFIQSGGNLRYNNNVTYYVRVPHPKTYYNVTTTDCGTCGRLLLNDAFLISKNP